MSLCCAAGLWAAATPATDAATPARVVLTATATFPGAASLQTFRSAIEPEDMVLAGAKVVARPDAATVMVEDRPHRTVRRNGKKVRVAVPACVRGTLEVALVPGLEDPVGLARLLLPLAQSEVFEDVRAGNDREESHVVWRIWRDTGEAEHDRPPANQQRAVFVEAWREHGLRAWAVTSMHTQRLRRNGVCDPAGSAGDSLPGIAELWMGGLS